MKIAVVLLLFSVGIVSSHHDSEGSSSEEEIICACPRINDPVCGSNGITYGNSCELRCHQQVNPGLTKMSRGECQGKAKTKICRCPRNLAPVCGSDGQTYSNKCLLECQQNKNRNLQMRHEGNCPSSSGPQVDPLEQPQIDPIPQVTPQPNSEGVCACPKILRPVCGTDGQTYSNKCLLDCETKKNPDVKMSYNGNCDKRSERQVDPIPQIQVDPVPSPEPQQQPQAVCPCPRILRPVCGTDGKSYSNRCLLDCQTKKNPDVKFSSDGYCQESSRPQVDPIQQPQVSPMRPQVSPMRPQVSPMQPQVSPMRPQVSPMRPQVSPMRPQVSPMRPQVKPMPKQTDPIHQPQVDPMPQPQENSASMVCPCPKILLPVCGTDGQTYSNQCNMKCQAKKNPDLKLKHKGPCDNKTESKFESKDSCICPMNYAPVCGSDGQTYSNKCTLQCQKTKYKDLEMKHNGFCEEKTESNIESKDSCICPMNYAPVCGSDGQTYSNKCTLQCQKTKDKDLEMKHDGSCEEKTGSNIESNDSCICPMNYHPVCGSDGQTYPNKCTLQCQKSKNKDLNYGYDGPCQTTDSSPK